MGDERLDPRLNDIYKEALHDAQLSAIKGLPTYVNGLKKVMRRFITKRPAKDKTSGKNEEKVPAKDFLRAGEQLLAVLPAFNRNITRDQSEDADNMEDIQKQLKKYGIGDK